MAVGMQSFIKDSGSRLIFRLSNTVQHIEKADGKLLLMNPQNPVLSSLQIGAHRETNSMMGRNYLIVDLFDGEDPISRLSLNISSALAATAPIKDIHRLGIYDIYRPRIENSPKYIRTADSIWSRNLLMETSPNYRKKGLAALLLGLTGLALNSKSYESILSNLSSDGKAFFGRILNDEIHNKGLAEIPIQDILKSPYIWLVFSKYLE